MVIVFDKEYLRDLFQNGRSNDKNYRFQPDIVKPISKSNYNHDKRLLD